MVGKGRCSAVAAALSMASAVDWGRSDRLSLAPSFLYTYTKHAFKHFA